MAQGTTAVIRGGANTHLAVQKWSKSLFKFSWANDPMRPFIGKGPNNIIELKNDLMGSAGDKVQFDIFALLTGSGEGDDGVYETNEEKMVSYYMDILIHERGNSIKLNGKMTEKRTIHNLRTQARYQLGTWLQRKRSADVIAALSGLNAKTFGGQMTGAYDKDSTGTPVQIKTVSDGTAVAPPKEIDALRWFGGGQTITGTIERVADDGDVDSVTTNLFGTNVISYVKRMAERTVAIAVSTAESVAVGDPISPIAPIMVKGKKMYVMFIDEFQAKALKQEAAWLSAQQSANIRGETNPIFSGAMGIWDGVVIHVNQLIHRRTGAGGTLLKEGFEENGTITTDPCASGVTVARALFCGSQAACLAQGQYPTYVEKIHDYKTKAGYHTDVIYGVEKTKFNSIDFGVITVDTAVVIDGASG